MGAAGPIDQGIDKLSHYDSGLSNTECRGAGDGAQTPRYFDESTVKSSFCCLGR